MKAAIYVRVSTKDQSIESQVHAIMEYVRKNEIVHYQIFKDEGVSGRKCTRPGFDKMMAAMAGGEFTHMICYSLSRVGRSVIHLHETLKQLSTYDVKFVSITEAMDQSTPAGKLIFGVLSVIAEFEVDLIRERTKAGLENAAAQGRHGGAPKKEISRADVQKMRLWGTKWKDIAAHYGVAVNTVRARLDDGKAKKKRPHS